MVKYSGLDIYDEYMNKIYIVDHEGIHVINNEGWTLILIPDDPNATLTGNELYYICGVFRSLKPLISGIILTFFLLPNMVLQQIFIKIQLKP